MAFPVPVFLHQAAKLPHGNAVLVHSSSVSPVILKTSLQLLHFDKIADVLQKLFCLTYADAER